MNDKLYKFFFAGVEEPIEIQASCSREARLFLVKILPTLDPIYQGGRPVIGQTVTKLLVGVSFRVDKKGIKYIWVGFDKAKTGWQTEADLEAAAKMHDEKSKIVTI